ncbi:MAG TPA: hypothetical protein P5254_02240 [Aquihabitans sp.]|nr:hypothetical protein [Aquihabitans sp.]
MFIPVAVAAVFALLGQPLRAGVVAAFALVAALLILAGVPLATWVERGVGWLARGLTAVSGAVVFVVIIGPAWTWGRIVRRDPFERKRHDRGWAVHPDVAPAPRSLGSHTPLSVGRRSLPSRLTWSAGCLVLLLVANYAVGWGFDRVTDHPARPTVSIDDLTATTTGSDGTASTTTTFPVPPRSASRYDPRADLPAMAAYPWRYDYFADIQRTPSIYWPYTQYRPVPFRSPYVNIDGWTRRSYRTGGSASGRPVVWMFGGSTTWGEGQRDEYTIASWLARLAEEAGTPIEISNYGERGWTHFQEMILYEQQLALVGAPDLSVFYDGINEVNTQSLVPEAVPSHYGVPQDAAAADGKTFATQFQTVPSTDSLLEDLWYRYSEHSLIHKISNFLSEPAGASPADDPPDVVGETFDTTVQDGTDAGRVYERGKQMTLDLSERYGVPTLLYWQPTRVLDPASEAAREEVTAPTIDIADLLLDRQDVFIDGGHTNEEGARIVAERIWQDLAPQIEAWYEANP